MDDDRREFLKQAGGVTAAAVTAPVFVSTATIAAGASGVIAAVAATPALAQRASAAGRYGLELDGIMAGWLNSTEGGHATADVVVEKLGPDHIARKHIGGVKYEDITLSCGTGMSKAFYEWIKDSLDLKYERKSGAIVAADYNFQELASLSFHNALITEFGMPALDAASKDAAKMTVKFSPEYTRFKAGDGSKVQGGAVTQKRWHASNFRLTIDGLDTSRVNKIEALVIKQKVIDNAVGEQRDVPTAVAYLEVPDLVITFPESQAADFWKWHEDFVINGNNDQDHEKTGSLTYLAPNLKDALFTLNFFGLGIFKCEPEKTASGSESLRRVKAEMYCEEIKFDYHATST
jgi:phage tail-like protein